MGYFSNADIYNEEDEKKKKIEKTKEEMIAYICKFDSTQKVEDLDTKTKEDVKELYKKLQMMELILMYDENALLEGLKQLPEVKLKELYKRALLKKKNNFYRGFRENKERTHYDSSFDFEEVDEEEESPKL